MFISHQCETNSDHNNPPHLWVDGSKAKPKASLTSFTWPNQPSYQRTLLSQVNQCESLSHSAHIFFLIMRFQPASQFWWCSFIPSRPTIKVFCQLHTWWQGLGPFFFSPIMVGWQTTLVKSVSLFLHFHNSPKEVRAYNVQSTLLSFVGQFEISYDLVVDEPQLSWGQIFHLYNLSCWGPSTCR
jgi:hypothetical protein